MTKHFITTLMLCLFSITTLNSLFAQSRCLTDEKHAVTMEDPAVAAEHDIMMEKLYAKVSEAKSITCTNGVIVIPIAVHYYGAVSTANTQCLIDAALAQVEVLNQDFGAYNADLENYCDLVNSCPATFPSSAISSGSCIQFCLADQNHPACAPTLIGGYAITVDAYNNDNATTCWDDYMNIFVYPISGGTLGFVNQIGAGNNPVGNNGVSVTSSAFGGVGSGCNSGTGIGTGAPFNRGRTVTHEVGHWLGLNHIFNGCGSGDGIADTPSSDTPNYGCPTYNGCNSTAENSCGSTDFSFNYMDYVDDACMYMFTDDQAQVMYNLAQPQSKWAQNVCSTAPNYTPTYSGEGCTVAAAPVASFTPTSGSQTICPGECITFTDASTNSPNSWNWTFGTSGDLTLSNTTSTIASPTICVTTGTSGTVSAALIVSNAIGDDSANGSVSVTVLDSNDAACQGLTTAIGCNLSAPNDGLAITNSTTITTTISPSTFCPGDQATISIAGCDFGGPYSGTDLLVVTAFDVFYESDGTPGLDATTDTYLTTGTYFGLDDGNGGTTTGCEDIVINVDDVSACDGTPVTIYLIGVADFYDTSGASPTFSSFDNGDCGGAVTGTVICESCLLPIELLSFNAKSNDEEIVVNWATSNEINNKGFSLLRSTDASKGFEQIAFVDGYGHSDYEQSYEFIDRDVKPGITYYYQLIAEDFDGKTTDHGIASALIESSNTTLTISPNPASDLLNVFVYASNAFDAQIMITDITGKIVLQENTKIDGAVNVPLNISNLANGVYHISVNHNGTIVKTDRFIKR